MGYLELLQLAAPQAILLIAALAVLGVDLGALSDSPPITRRRVCALFSGAGCLLAGGWMVAAPAHGKFLEGVLVVDALTLWAAIGVVCFTLLTIAIAADSALEAHVGEYFSLILMGTVGMLFLVSTEDLLMAFVSLELTSLSLYALTAFVSGRAESIEAALRYFLFGTVAAAMTLFGMSLLYGLSGSTSLSAVAHALAQSKGFAPLMLVATVMTAAGFAFKVAAAPFHLWAPDAYQAAPVSAGALIASGSKVAGFFILAKVMLVGFGGAGVLDRHEPGMPPWVLLLGAISAMSVVAGNLTALAQRRVKRLLAYSAVAHAGYILLGAMTPTPNGIASLLFYVVTYGLATVGVFAVLAVLEFNGIDDTFAGLAGLGRRSVFLSSCLLIFVLSLAGIPPLSGFFAKFWLFAAAMRGDDGVRLLWLVLLALAGSAVSLYYYLQILKQVYLRPVTSDDRKLSVPLLSRLALTASAAGVVLLGCLPESIVASLIAAAKTAFKV